MGKTIVLIISLLISFSSMFGQTNNIINNLTSDKTPGHGKVTINQNVQMVNQMKKIAAKKSKDLHIFYSGYRVQVYMGNNQKLSKLETKARETKLKEKYKDIACYTTFSAPFWKLRVGDFRTFTDALVFAQTIKNDFPSYAADISIVKDEETRDIAKEKEE